MCKQAPKLFGDPPENHSTHMKLVATANFSVPGLSALLGNRVSHKVFPLWAYGESNLWCPFLFLWGHNSCGQGPLFWPHLSLNTSLKYQEMAHTSLKGLSPNMVKSGVRTSTYEKGWAIANKNHLSKYPIVTCYSYIKVYIYCSEDKSGKVESRN